MVVRAGGGTFRKLSIPRDVLAEIPGAGPQKINSAYAIGGAKLTIETVENFLGIDIDHLAIVDFTGFRDFIDALGGIEVDLDERVCSEISGGEENGGITLDLQKGENDLNGDEALSLARTRTAGDCDDDGVPDSEINDLDRVRFQQEIISGIKGKLTSPLSLPFNFLRGPLIGWNAPKALVTDMGALTMPQLLFAAVIGGDSPTKVLEPSSSDGSSLFVSQDECLEKVEELLGSAPDRDPACSP
jgi:LCP family protein required for cell wall assembly